MEVHTLNHRYVTVSVRQVAEMYGLPSRRSVYYALTRGLIRGTRVYGGWLIDVRDLPDAWPVKPTRRAA